MLKYRLNIRSSGFLFFWQLENTPLERYISAEVISWKCSGLCTSSKTLPVYITCPCYVSLQVSKPSHRKTLCTVCHLLEIHWPGLLEKQIHTFFYQNIAVYEMAWVGGLLAPDKENRKYIFVSFLKNRSINDTHPHVCYKSLCIAYRTSKWAHQVSSAAQW